MAGSFHGVVQGLANSRLVLYGSQNLVQGQRSSSIRRSELSIAGQVLRQHQVKRYPLRRSVSLQIVEICELL